MSEKIKKEIESLRKKVRKHDRLYYLKGTPIISDSQYDRLYRRLKELEEKFPSYDSPDSPTKRVGGGVLEQFRTLPHREPMLSLDNLYSKEELKGWLKKREKKTGENKGYVVEEKIDGVAISLTYENGILTLALSRGNGREGDDITRNIKRQMVIPLRLDSSPVPDMVEIRGELYISLSEFRRINSIREEKGKNVFANPRNACAGSLKLLDPSKSARRRMSAFFYSVGAWEGAPPPRTQEELLNILSSWGLPVNKNFYCSLTLNDIFESIEKLRRFREERDYEVDGAVIKVNSIKDQKNLGATVKSPRWAVAYKYESKKAITLIKDIEYSVGRTGTITPVAKLEPVKVGGVTISRATMHNFDFTEKIKAGKGDRVEIERGGDVIPKILGLVKKSPNSKGVPLPAKCPSCGEKIRKDPEGVYIRCLNISCPAQLKQKLIHYGSPGAMDIQGLGESVAGQLVEEGLVKKLPHLYRLRKRDLIRLDLFADRKADNLIKEIDESRECSLDSFIWALGIRQVGRHIASVLANRLGSMEALSAAGRDELEEIKEIGPVVAKNIVNFFSGTENKETVRELLNRGVKPRLQNRGGGLEGESFVFTGSLKKYSRNEAKMEVEERGGRAVSSPSSATDYLVIGENPGSKAEKGKKLGLKIIDEEEFEELIGK